MNGASPKPVPESPAHSTAADRKRKMLVVHNPVAGWWQRNKLKRFLKSLRHHDLTVTVRKTAHPGDATMIAAKAVTSGVSTIVAAGGDGTVRETAQGVRGSDVTLGFLPLGTANILAVELGLKQQPEAVADALETAVPQTCYTGTVGRDRFLLMVSAGIDSRVVARVSPRVKRVLSQGAYVLAAVQELCRPRWSGPVQALADGREISADLIIVTRAKHYAGPFCIAPEADLRDRYLYVVAPQRRGFFAMLRYAAALLTNRLASLPDVDIVRAQEVTLLGPADHPVQADGDLIGTLPVTIRCDGDTSYQLLWPEQSLPT